MKKTFLYILTFGALALVASYSCSEEETPIIYGCTDSLAVNFDDTANTDDGSCVRILNRYNSLAIIFTSNLDSNCGDFVPGLYDIMQDEIQGLGTLITVHPNDSLATIHNAPIANQLVNFYAVAGFPTLTVNSTNFGTADITAADTIQSYASNQFVILGGGSSLTIGDGVNSGSLNLDVYVKCFLQDVDKLNYYMNVYFIDRGITFPQLVYYPQIVDTNFVHRNVLVGALDDIDFKGTLLNKISPSTGDILPMTPKFFEHFSYVYEYPEEWDALGIEAVVVIWEEDPVSGAIRFHTCSVLE